MLSPNLSGLPEPGPLGLARRLERNHLVLLPLLLAPEEPYGGQDHQSQSSHPALHHSSWSQPGSPALGFHADLADGSLPEHPGFVQGVTPVSRYGLMPKW